MDEIKKIIKPFIIIIIIIIFTIIIMSIMNQYNKEYYKAKDFNIKTVYSKTDYDSDNIDDYSDFVLGARRYIENNPTYIYNYYEDTYPPSTEGISADVIWHAFKNAGYSLRTMINNDIINNPSDYPDITELDEYNDYRQVNNLNIFFSKYAESLTIDIEKIDKWQPGDIVIFENNHIGIISDRRNSSGIPFVIHQSDKEEKEDDYLTTNTITAHYRFNASKISKDILMKWEE